MSRKLDLFIEQLKSIDVKKVPNTFLSVIGRKKDEVIISSLVAFAISPENSNEGIIEQILVKTQSDYDECNFVDLMSDKENRFISVDTEEWISNESRVDIIIRFSKFWIVIENKVDSSENGDQSLRYEADLEKVGLPVKYICLKPNYNKCVLSNRKFVDFYYSELVEILKQFSDNDFRDKDSYLYVNELIKHSEVYLMKNSDIEINKYVKLYIENKDEVDILVKNYNEQCKNVREKLLNRIKEKFNITNNMNDMYRVSEKVTHDYIQLWKSNWPNGIHYEIGYNLINIIGKGNVITYRIDNESGKFSNLPKVQIKYENKYDFDSLENIEKSINSIVDKLQEIVSQNDEMIDMQINSMQFLEDKKFEFMNRLKDKINSRFNINTGFNTYYSTNKNIEYIQIWKEEWDNTDYMGLHYEILCDMKSLLNNEIDVKLAIHNEAKTRRKYPDIKSQNIKEYKYIVDSRDYIEKITSDISSNFVKIMEDNRLEI